MAIGAASAFAQQLPFGYWSSASNYHIGDIIARSGSAGTDLYKAVADNSNQDPSTDSGAYWKFYQVFENWTLDVGSGQRFATFLDAWNFVDDSSIPDGVVTIQIHDGTYDLGKGLSITEPCASRVKIIGNSANPGNVILRMNTYASGALQSALFIDTTLLYLDGITLQNYTGHALPAYSTALGIRGRVVAGTVVVDGSGGGNGFPLGIYVYNGGALTVNNTASVSYCDVGFRSEGASIDFSHDGGPVAYADHCLTSFAAYGGRMFSSHGDGISSTNATTYDFLLVGGANICFPGSTRTFTGTSGISNQNSTLTN